MKSTKALTDLEGKKAEIADRIAAREKRLREIPEELKAIEARILASDDTGAKAERSKSVSLRLESGELEKEIIAIKTGSDAMLAPLCVAVQDTVALDLAALGKRRAEAVAVAREAFQGYKKTVAAIRAIEAEAAPILHASARAKELCRKADNRFFGLEPIKREEIER
jgi:hypothetical protein